MKLSPEKEKVFSSCVEILSSNFEMIEEAREYSTPEARERELEKFREIITLSLPSLNSIIDESSNARMEKLRQAELYLKELNS